MKLEAIIKEIARKSGAALVGIASKERLEKAPPSGDVTYLLPSAESVISFALPINEKSIDEYFGKQKWLEFWAEFRPIDQTLYKVADRLHEYLESRGYESRVVDLNMVYRPEPGGTGATIRTLYLPDFSHRYAAVAAGVGWLGWSGNLITEDYGANVLLGSVLTSAKLTPDPMLTDHPDRCSDCRICFSVCPSGYFRSKESVSVVIGGKEWVYAKRGTPMRCGITCNGYHGISQNGRWSTWSPYRLPKGLSIENEELDNISRRVRTADPYKQQVGDCSQREFCFDPSLAYMDTCANCQFVCAVEKNIRKKYRNTLIKSGIVALTASGKRIPLGGDDVMWLDTPYDIQVAVPKKEKSLFLDHKLELYKCENEAEYPLDAVILSYFSGQKK